MFTTTKNVALANAVTHNATFHGDDVLCTVILSKIFDNLTVYRTDKIPENLSEDVIVFDIGNGKYDHHQKGGNGARKLDPPYVTKTGDKITEIPYASIGLLWKEFGYKLLEKVCTSELRETVWSIIDHDLIQGIDAMDNGIMPQADYPCQVLNLYKIIFEFNPTWDSSQDSDEAFMEAVAFADSLFDRILANAVSKVKAQAIVEEAIEKSEENIMILDQYVPWDKFIFASSNPKAADIEFVIFPSNRGGYNCQCVPDAPGSFGQRKPLPEAWRGLRDKALQDVSGVETAIFCHPTGFMCAAETREDAIRLAKFVVFG